MIRKILGANRNPNFEFPTVNPPNHKNIIQIQTLPKPSEHGQKRWPKHPKVANTFHGQMSKILPKHCQHHPNITNILSVARTSEGSQNIPGPNFQKQFNHGQNKQAVVRKTSKQFGKTCPPTPTTAPNQ
jgi:hypothetical protein